MGMTLRSRIAPEPFQSGVVWNSTLTWILNYEVRLIRNEGFFLL
jgi:hypothetical protein